MKVLVCGSRVFANPFAGYAIDARIAALPDDAHVIHGDARGADNLAASAAMLRGLRVSDLVIAFWDGESKGTAHTIGEARKRGIPVEVVSP